MTATLLLHWKSAAFICSGGAGDVRAPPEFWGSEKGQSLISAYESLAISVLKHLWIWKDISPVFKASIEDQNHTYKFLDPISGVEYFTAAKESLFGQLEERSVLVKIKMEGPQTRILC